MNKQETLTKEQQDNVATWILRSYQNIDKIKFYNFKKDLKTGYYHLSIELNGDETKRTTISFAKVDILNENTGTIGLNPINRFKDLQRDNDLEDIENVDLNHVYIEYIGE